MQAAQRDDFVMLLLRLRFESGEDGVPLLAFRRSDRRGLHGVGIFILLAQPLLGHELGISAQQNIGTAAGHVGRDRDHALAARLRHQERFALVILGVQDFVPDAHLAQDLR